MVRPYYESPRQKHRPFANFHGSQEFYGGMHPDDRYSPRSRNHREVPQWREGGEASHFHRRPEPMDGRRGPPEHLHWGLRSRSPVYAYPIPAGPQRGHRRQPHPAAWPGRRSPQCLPPQRSPPHRVPFHGHSPHLSPRYFHSEMGRRRSWSPSPPPNRQRSAEREHGWASVPGFGRERRSREEPVCGERWNREGGFKSPHTGERKFSMSPQRKSQDFHRRSPYPERLSTKQETRMCHRSEGQREGDRRSPRYPHGSPKWRSPPSSSVTSAAPSSSSSPPRFHHHYHPQERTARPPVKRGSQDEGSELDQRAKRVKREGSQRPPVSRGFGGRVLSLKDKSRLLKGRIRAASELASKEPPHISKGENKADKVKHSKSRPAKHEETKEQPPSGKAASKNAVKAQDPKKQGTKKVPHKSPTAPDDTADEHRGTDTLTIKVDMRHNLSTCSSSPSPSDRQVSRDLVTVSQRSLRPKAGTHTSTSSRSKTKDTQTENCSSLVDKQTLTLNERFSKLQNQHLSQDDSGGYSGVRIERKIEVPLMNHETTKLKTKVVPLKSSLHCDSPERKPVLVQRQLPVYGPGPPRRLGPFQKPIMPRPSFIQRPFFKKSQNITTKYRHMQALRHQGTTPYWRNNSLYNRSHAYFRGPFRHRW